MNTSTINRLKNDIAFYNALDKALGLPPMFAAAPDHDCHASPIDGCPVCQKLANDYVVVGGRKYSYGEYDHLSADMPREEEE